MEQRPSFETAEDRNRNVVRRGERADHRQRPSFETAEDRNTSGVVCATVSSQQRPSFETAEDRNTFSGAMAGKLIEAAAVFRDGRGSQHAQFALADTDGLEQRPSFETAEDRNLLYEWMTAHMLSQRPSFETAEDRNAATGTTVRSVCKVAAAVFRDGRGSQPAEPHGVDDYPDRSGRLSRRPRPDEEVATTFG